jgi:TnpA family transposase
LPIPRVVPRRPARGVSSFRFGSPTVGRTDTEHLLGMQFSPRIRDLGNQQLYRLDRSPSYPNLEPRLKNRIRQDLIVRRWDDLLLG